MRRASVTMVLGLLGGSAALVAIDGCTIVNGLVLLPDDAATATDAPSDGLDGGDAKPSDGCDHALPPPPPNVPDTADNQIIVAVAKKFLLSSMMGADPVGYDLDGKCSGTAGAPETCIGQKPQPDPGGHGVDNNAGKLFELVNNRTDLEERVNTGIVAGRNTLLVRISGYNGKRDDPSVTISVFASPGLFDGADKNVAPLFDANELWSLDDAQFSAVAPDLPTTTTQGYVANGIAVGFLSATTSVALSSSFSVTLNSAFITVALDLSGKTPTIQSGILAGRWPASDMLRVVARQRTSEASAPLCGDSTTYMFVKNLVCSELDIAANRAGDGKGRACDATSAALQFLAAPGGLGPKRPVPADDPCPTTPPDDCADGG